jgi:hypothetical protein
MAYSIEDFIPHYPDLTSPDFTYDLSRLKEFAELYLDKSESVSDIAGELLYHQLFIQRFFSPYTSYMRALVAHRPGTGKTCTAVGVVEGYRHALISGKPRKPALLFVKSEDLGRNITNEIANVCTSGIYTPKLTLAELKKGKVMSEDTRIARLNREVSRSYEIVTYDTYLRKLPEDDGILKRMVEDRDIIFDEGHIIRPQPKKKGTAKGEEGEEEAEDEQGLIKDSATLYTQAERMLKFVNGHVLILTGTPMWDQARDIAPLMNLILDDSQKLPTGKAFDDRYFDADGNLVDDVDDLREAFKGRVSFLREMLTSAQRIEMGVTEPFTKYIKIFPDGMSDIQSEYSTKARESVETKTVRIKGKQVERQTVGGTVYKLARDAMNMVIPTFDSKGEITGIAYGPEAFKEYVIKPITKRGPKGGTTKINTYSIDNVYLRKELTNHLAEYSAKFASVIEDIKAHPDEVTFIYNEEVTGLGGAIMQGLCMQLHGFAWAKSAIDIEHPSQKRRFAVITSDSQTTNNPKQIQDLLASCNRPDNRHGDRLQVIIGSEKIALGLTIKNVRRIHIMMPHWNIPSIDQAEARGYRFGSHDALEPEERHVHIFRHAAVDTASPNRGGVARGLGYPKDASFSDTETTDIYIYRLAEDKDYRTAQIYRVMKEAAPDCAAFYRRNVLPTDVDNTRACDYQRCNYVCDGFPPVSRSDKVWSYKIPIQDLDYSTYNVLYASDKISSIIDDIIALFHNYFSMFIDAVQRMIQLPPSEKPLLLHAIDTIIESRLVIRDRYGFKCYLKEEGNMLFLVDSLTARPRYAQATYVEMPLVKHISSLDSLVEILEYQQDKPLVDRVCKKASAEDFEKLSYKTRILLLEVAYQYNQTHDSLNPSKSDAAVDMILDEMEASLYEMKDGSVVHILYSTEYKGTSYNVASKDIKASGLMRRYNPELRGWEDVPSALEEGYIKQIKEHITAQKEIGFEDNPYGIYGWVSNIDGSFRINVKPTKKKKGKIRGKECQNLFKAEIIDIFIDRINYFPTGDSKKRSREELLGLIRGEPGYQPLKEKLDTYTTAQLDGILYMLTLKREELCGLLKDWLAENQLIYNI